MAEEDPPAIQTYIARGEQLSPGEASQRRLISNKRFDIIAFHGIYGLEARSSEKVRPPALIQTHGRGGRGSSLL